MRFACMECGHVFRSVAAAERAAFGPDGCPKCGGSDVDEVEVQARSATVAERREVISDAAARETPASADVAYERARGRWSGL